MMMVVTVDWWLCGCVTEEQESNVEMIFNQGTEPAKESRGVEPVNVKKVPYSIE